MSKTNKNIIVMKKITILFAVVIMVIMVAYLAMYEQENRKLWRYYHVTEEVFDSLDVKYDIADELPSEYYDVIEELN